MSTGPALETRALVKRFGGLTATNDVTFRLEAGARHALIGPNGAGKTTLVNLLTGLIAPTSGQIFLDGRDVTRLGISPRVKAGLARTFQINQLFGTLTPAETLALAVAERGRAGGRLLAGLGDVGLAAEVQAVAALFGLTDALDEPTARLPYGRQRLLEIALAFACRPRVLLLDEPAAGVPEAERHEILAAIAGLPRSVSVLLIEHDMDLVFSFAERVTVLVEGAIFKEGSVREIAADPGVKAVYLGSGHDG